MYIAQYDVAVLMEGMRVARRFASAPALRKRLLSGLEVRDTTIPYPQDSDEYLR